MDTTPTANELAQQRTDLAANRNLMAADRTLMAWIRTALSLLSFGFTIYKVLETLQQGGGLRHTSPRNAGLFLAAMGTLAMVMGTLEYLQTRKSLQPNLPVPFFRPSFVMAVIMSIAGVALFIGIVTGAL
jgi:putative membrane protein